MAFSTGAANDAFKAAFTLPVSVLLSPPVELATSKELYTTRRWGSFGRMGIAPCRRWKETSGTCPKRAQA